MMVMGILLVFSPIISLMGYIPMVGGLINGSLFVVVLVGAFIICIPLWIITFSIAWTCYHPKVGIAFLAIGLAVLTTIVVINYRKSAST